MDVKAQSERAEHGNGCIVAAETQKELAGNVDAIELFKSYTKIVAESQEHPTLREPNGVGTAQLNAYIDFSVKPDVDKVSLVNEKVGEPMAGGRELSWMLIDSKQHKVIRVGCSEGPLEHPKF